MHIWLAKMQLMFRLRALLIAWTAREGNRAVKAKGPDQQGWLPLVRAFTSMF
jgi:hypothetical protein